MFKEGDLMEGMLQTMGVMGKLYLIINLLITIELVVGFILIVIAIWRGTNAHISIARTLKNIADNLKSEPH